MRNGFCYTSLPSFSLDVALSSRNQNTPSDARSLDGSNTSGAIWSYVLLSRASSIKDIPQIYVTAITLVRCGAGNYLLCDTYNNFVRCGKRSNKGRSFLTNCLVRMDAGFEYHGTTRVSPESILWIYQSINGVLISKFTAWFSTIPNKTLPCKSPIRTKRRIFPKAIADGSGFQSEGVTYMLVSQ